MASPTLRIRLLGGFDLRLGDTPLPSLESARTESLLAYLLLHRDTPQPRQRLAFMLWPDSTEPQARTNLRHLLHILRHALPDPDRFLDVTPRTLQWRADAPSWLDVACFEDAIERAEGAADGGLAALREAIELYAGDLLDGHYDEWILRDRERLRSRYLGALASLIGLLQIQGDVAEAIRHAERLQQQDPVREETYRLLMGLHDARGDRARALRVYHDCVTTLERELSVEPAAATREVYESLLSVEAGSSRASRSGPRLGGHPFIGRAAERSRLAGLWRQTERGRAQLVLVSGEPGVGKTRLVEEFRSWSVHRGAVTVQARSYAAEGTLAYGPVVTWLRSTAVRSGIGHLDRARLVDLARLLPELRDTIPGLPRPEPLPESDQRQRLFDAVTRAILAAGSPLLLVADDLQWWDRESLQAIHYLLRAEPGARLLVAATARREETDDRHPMVDVLTGLHALDCCTEIQLERFTQAETAALAGGITGRPIAELDVDDLHDETEGNALFVVEALRAGWQHDRAVRERLSPKVQAVIQARLAQLSEPARELIGIAATIGREFTADVLVDAAGTGVDDAVRGLDELWRRRIIREHGSDAYDFSHDKIREVAYADLGPARRRDVHLRVARSLERVHANDPGPVSGQFAVHYERAGQIDTAVAWYIRAAEAAQQLHASDEAIRLLEHALELLHTLPENAARRAQELAVLAALPAPLGWVDGWASERLAAVQRRALGLAEALGVELAPPLLRSLAFASLARRDFVAARGLSERLHAQGVRDADEMLVVEADYLLGIIAFWQGAFESARSHLQSAVDRYHPEQRRAHLLRYGLDPKVICLSRLGNTFWFLGEPEAAIRARDEALALAAEIGHPYSLATALVFAAMLSIDMHDPDGVREYEALLAAELGRRPMRPNRISAEAIGGYVDVIDGRVEAGIARIERVLEESRDVDHAPGMRASLVRTLLEAYAVAGDARAGLAAADRALALGDADRLWEAETRRLRAEFLAALGAPAGEVEAERERALDIARRQGATMLELRAATDLLRHRTAQGNDAGISRARALLAHIVARVPGTPETEDLRSAVALLGPR